MSPREDEPYGRGPSLRNRFVARQRSEVPLADLQAFRRAGAVVGEVLLLAETRRRELSAAGTHPWDADAASASLFLCAWNARVHQELAIELLDSDRRQDPRTSGFVPPVTHRAAMQLFAPVEPWVSAAQRAAVNDDFWVGDTVELPAHLPELIRPATSEPKYVRGLLTCGDVLLRLHEQALGEVLGAGPAPDAWSRHDGRLAELAAQAHSSLRYAQGLWQPHSSMRLQRTMLDHALPAMVILHHLGQFLALPELIDGYRFDSASRRRSRARRRSP